MTPREAFQTAEDASRLVFNTPVFLPEYQAAKEASRKAWTLYNDTQNADRAAQGLPPIGMIQF